MAEPAADGSHRPEVTPGDEWAMPCGGCGACEWSMAGEGSICDGTGMIREVLEAAEDSDEEETT